MQDAGQADCPGRIGMVGTYDLVTTMQGLAKYNDDVRLFKLH